MNVNFRDERFETDRTPETATEAPQLSPWEQGYPRSRNPMDMAAYESINAAFEQLAIGHYRVVQGYMLLTHAIELLLKSALQDLGWKIGQPKWIKDEGNRRLVEALTKVNVNPTEWERIIREGSFFKAFEEVARIFNLSAEANNRRGDVNAVRNEIVHRGGNPLEILTYIRLIVVAVLPVLDEVLFKTTGAGLITIIAPSVNRELVVVGRYLNTLLVDKNIENDPRISWHVLDSFQVAFRFFVQDGPPTGPLKTLFRDEVDTQDSSDIPAVLPFLRRPHILGLEPDRPAPSCRICGHRCFVQFEPRIRVNIGMECVKPLAVRCTQCGLFLTERLPGISRFHYGYLDADSLGDDLWLHLVEQIKDNGRSR